MVFLGRRVRPRVHSTFEKVHVSCGVLLLLGQATTIVESILQLSILHLPERSYASDVRASRLSSTTPAAIFVGPNTLFGKYCATVFWTVVLCSDLIMVLYVSLFGKCSWRTGRNLVSVDLMWLSGGVLLIMRLHRWSVLWQRKDIVKKSCCWALWTKVSWVLEWRWSIIRWHPVETRNNKFCELCRFG